ncbi:uncharacterized protein L969DRAFT_98403 [Mixia osmundae IAM 14324]|uniref:uncharacterized protein n=1 Tax=Mixia osmundae (strain CBS 9802 / IAM 14324 / JCM 22182 / KY 12970) TaxID=764103 RepID=UPI0004A559F8|nr:uncharacterized protein L969DRAFT_98403 [Mixia osmundae IAM 14324]KEI40553.1 hypothetical protein L969DRAFT_98403 [Mixia osmundae IAM 14324]
MAGGHGGKRKGAGRKTKEEHERLAAEKLEKARLAEEREQEAEARRLAGMEVDDIPRYFAATRPRSAYSDIPTAGPSHESNNVFLSPTQSIPVSPAGPVRGTSMRMDFQSDSHALARSPDISVDPSAEQGQFDIATGSEATGNAVAGPSMRKEDSEEKEDGIHIDGDALDAAGLPKSARTAIQQRTAAIIIKLKAQMAANKEPECYSRGTWYIEPPAPAFAIAEAFANGDTTVSPILFGQKRCFVWHPALLLSDHSALRCECGNLLTSHGWGNGRTVHTFDDIEILIGYRYQCAGHFTETPEGGRKAKKTFNSYDRFILDQLPRWLSAEFPYVLTGHSGVDRRLPQMMRTLPTKGAGTYAFAKHVEDSKNARRDHARYAYLSALTDAASSRNTYPAENLWRDPAYGLLLPSGSYLTEVSKAAQDLDHIYRARASALEQVSFGMGAVMQPPQQGRAPQEASNDPEQSTSKAHNRILSASIDPTLQDQARASDNTLNVQQIAVAATNAAAALQSQHDAKDIRVSVAVSTGAQSGPGTQIIEEPSTTQMHADGEPVDSTQLAHTPPEPEHSGATSATPEPLALDDATDQPTASGSGPAASFPRPADVPASVPHKLTWEQFKCDKTAECAVPYCQYARHCRQPGCGRHDCKGSINASKCGEALLRSKPYDAAKEKARREANKLRDASADAPSAKRQKLLYQSEV